MPSEIPAETPHHQAPPPQQLPISLIQDIGTGVAAVPISHYLWILRRHLWKMIAFVAACALVAFVVAARIKPIYESTATIDVDLAAPSGVVGQGSTTPNVTEDPDVFLTTQMRLIQSDAVLRPVAEEFHLMNPGDRASQGLNEVQETAQQPVSLSGLKVTRPKQTYLLLISYRSPDPNVAAAVANAVANSYLAQTYELRIRSSASLSSFMSGQLDELKAKMERSSLALAQFEKDMDVINPEAKTDILSARLLQLNTEYTTAQADRVSKEAAWDAMKSGSLEAAEISTQGASLMKLNDVLNGAQQRLAEAKSTYGTNHPEYRKAASALAEVQKQFDDARRSVSNEIALEYQESLNREQMLQKAVAETKAEWDRINASSFEYQQLKQDATADKALYNELITKIQEAGINAGFKDNNIRLADVAHPSLVPVYPDIKQILLMVLMFSTMLAIGAVIFLDILDTTLRDPEQASRFLGVDVVGMLPSDPSAAQPIGNAMPKYSGPVLARDVSGVGGDSGVHAEDYSGTSDFEEAVRTVRNTILLSDFEHRLHSILLTSASSSEGKTTTAVHLAIANAARGKKTLLVDADLRRPSIHTKFGLSPRIGLSSVLNGELSWREAVIEAEGRPDLSLLPSGPGSHRAADLIGQQLANLLDEFEKEYDLVILDSPPILAFAECLQMASLADGVLIITKAGTTKRRAVKSVLTMLARIRANVIGVVLNQMKRDTSAESYGYYGYHYRRNYYEKPREEQG